MRTKDNRELHQQNGMGKGRGEDATDVVGGGGDPVLGDLGSAGVGGVGDVGEADPIHAAVSAAVDEVFASVLDDVATGMNFEEVSPRSARDYAEKWVVVGGWGGVGWGKSS